MLKLIKLAIKFFIVMAIWFGLVLAVVIMYYYQGLPSLEDLEEKSNPTIEIQYSNGNKITTFGDFYTDQVIYKQIPRHLIEAVVATEDRRFFTHSGVDILGILRASYVNSRAGRIVQGGSTITQQLAKLLFLTHERTYKRKIQEILLAYKLENTFSKEQIITLYLNHAYFGAGNYGIAPAAKYYFNKPVAKINLNESAILAGLLKAPSKLSPMNNKALAENRANQVLSNMIDAGYIEGKNAKNLEGAINYKMDKMQRLYFSDYVLDIYDGFVDHEIKRNKNIIIKTSLDEKIQNIAEDEVDNFVTKNKLGKTELAVIIMSKDGAILGMIGGKNYQQSPFNRAVKSKRQAGSAFKTFVYLAAFEQGFKPGDIFEDKKTNIGDWNPENYNKKYYGEVSLAHSFALSLNSVAIQLTSKLNKKALGETIEKLGITADLDLNDPTMALGTTQLSLLELTSAYIPIADEGKAIITYGIEEIYDSKDEILYKRESSGLGSIIEDDHVEMMKKILRGVVEYGTGKNANVASNIYGKTGTSQASRDAWFIGFNDDYIIGVWMGNDDNSPTNKITGGTLPATLFGNIIKRL